MTTSDRLFSQTRPVKLFFLAAIPGAISMLASSLYQTLDGVLVGQGLGSTAFAAINLAMPFVIINFSVADLIGVGSSVPISISLGTGKKDEANAIFSGSVIMILLSSTILGALMFIAAPALMGLMGADGEFLDLAVTYLRVYALFSPVTTITFAMDNYLKISGKINTSMGLNIFMSVGAAIIEIIFIFIFRWGVWSAALATCLSMFISAIIAIVPFAMGKRSLKFVKPHLGKDVILRILSCGTPNFLSNIAGRITSIVMNMMLVRAGGQDAVSIYGVLMYADGLVQPILYGTCDALQPAIGYNWGAGKRSRVRAIEKCCVAGAIVISLVSFVLILGLPVQIASLFVDSSLDGLIEACAHALRIFAFAYVTRWISFVTQSFMLAIEKPKYAAIISTATALVFPLILLFALEGFGLDGIWFNFAGTNLLAAILSIFILVHEWRDIMRPDDPDKPETLEEAENAAR